ncbi:MAG: hypothetical protein FWG46_02700 [Treponema sp.]|nr:hypothetical protein [Treponema sp.]
MKRHIYLFLLFFAIIFAACATGAGWRENSGDASAEGADISARGAIGGLKTADAPRFEGDGGRGIRLAILAPDTQGSVPDYLPLYVQGLLNNNFGRYSAITLIDRQNLNQIIAEQNIAASGNYSDADYITIGNLTNTQYFLIGTIQRLSGNRYSLLLSITEAGTGIRRANYMMGGTLAQLEGTGTLINEASADLLSQMGVRLTSTGKQALLAGNTTTVRAQAAQAQGIIAQAGGQELEALLSFSQSVAFDPSQMEALSRLTSLSSTISSGSISERIVNDIQARNQWLETFKETARFFSDHPPVEIIFDSNLVQIGNTDYVKGTADLGMRIALNPTEAGFNALNSILEGLNRTGRRSVWGFDGWPLEDISPKTAGTVVFGGSRSFVYHVEVALYNEANKTLGRNTVILNTGTIPYFAGDKRIQPPSPAYETVRFSGIKAVDLTPTLNIVIVAVNGIPSRNIAASGYMRIDTGELEEKSRLTEQRREQQEAFRIIETASQSRAVGAAFLNPLLGLGSLTQGDSIAASRIFLIEGAGVGLMLGGYLNRDKQGKVTYDSDGNKKTENPLLMLGFGVGIYAAGAIYGFIAPYLYHQEHTGARFAYTPPLDIELVSDDKGNAAVQFSYTKRF